MYCPRVSNAVLVRRFETRDAGACRALWEELTSRHRELYDDLSIGGDDPGSGFDDYLDEFGAECLWVADDGGSVVGFAGLIVRGRKAEVEPVVVSAPRRGEGVGRALVEALVQQARAREIHQLVVRPVARNADAVAFFNGLGFTALGHVELLLDFRRPPDYWRPGERLAGRDFDV
jgi:GNAT superfamily N-acetyltransferase